LDFVAFDDKDEEELEAKFLVNKFKQKNLSSRKQNANTKLPSNNSVSKMSIESNENELHINNGNTLKEQFKQIQKKMNIKQNFILVH